MMIQEFFCDKDIKLTHKLHVIYNWSSSQPTWKVEFGMLLFSSKLLHWQQHKPDDNEYITWIANILWCH